MRQTSGPNADLNSTIKSQPCRTVEFENAKFVGQLVELDATVETAAGTWMDEISLSRALEFSSRILQKKKRSGKK
jgi:hypothetical protein